MSRGRGKGRFPFVACTNAHQVVGAPQVQFCEVVRPMHLFDYGWDEG